MLHLQKEMEEGQFEDLQICQLHFSCWENDETCLL